MSKLILTRINTIKNQIFHKAALYCSLMLMIVLSVQVYAQPSSPRGRGIYGDWQVKVELNELTMSRGTQKVKGVKVVRTFRRGGTA